MVELNMKRSIAISVISSVCVLVFIQPILNFLWKVISWGSVNFYKGLINGVYKNAALGQRDWVSVILFFLFVASVIGFSSSFLTLPLIRKLRRIKEAKGEHVFRRVKKILITIYCVLSIMFLFVLIYLFVSVYVDLQLNTSFQQRLNALSPEISDFEYKNLKADWALMKSPEDYNSIVLKMEEFAQKHKIKLPDLLIQK